MAQHQFYKIKLKPQGAFYFGNEQTLGDGNLNYFARSNHFPQQTTLLGMLRYRLLQMKGWLKDENGQSAAPVAAAEKLIGTMGFRTTQANPADFGAIQSLSPVFIESTQGLLVPGALNRGYTFTCVEVEPEPIVHSTWGGINELKRSYLPHLDGFDYKNPLEEHLMLNKTGAKLEYHEVFKDYDQVGITKKRENETDDKAFYKQTAYRFTSTELAFVFWVELDQTTGNELMQYCAKHPVVTMGGERSQFMMEMQPDKMDKVDFSQYAEQGDRAKAIQVVLLSDARVEPEVYEDCLFAITEISDFRYILTEQATQNHYQHRALPLSTEDHEPEIPEEELTINDETAAGSVATPATAGPAIKKGRRPTRSVGYNLLRKGSVFYLTDAQQLQTLRTKLCSAVAFRQIGYNAFIVIQNGQVKVDYFHSNHPQNH